VVSDAWRVVDGRSDAVRGSNDHAVASSHFPDVPASTVPSIRSSSILSANSWYFPPYASATTVCGRNNMGFGRTLALRCPVRAVRAGIGALEGLRKQQRRDPSLSSEKRAWRCGGVNAAKLGGSFLQRYMDETSNKRSYLLQAALETGFGPQRVRAPRRLRPSSDHRPNLTRLPGRGVGVGVAVLLYPTHELEHSSAACKNMASIRCDG
jgi:hypothetical protein